LILELVFVGDEWLLFVNRPGQLEKLG
jgi:hypothetical protein